MRYFLCVVPPVGVLASKPLALPVNLLLTLCFYFPGLIHALLCVGDAKANERNGKLMKVIKKGQGK